MKRLFTLLLFSASLFTLFAQTKNTMNVVETLYYDRDVFIASDEERAKLNDLIEQMKADSTLKIHIIGNCDRWGGKEVNDRFSYVRAMCIADWMRSCRVPREQITFVGSGIDTLAVNDKHARRVDILREIEVAEAKAETTETAEATEATETTETTEATETTETAETTEIVEPQPDSVTTQPSPSPTKNKFEWNYFTPRTNLLYWAAGMMNLGVEYRQPESSFGFLLNLGYSLFGDTNWNHNLGGWFVAPEVRYYFPSNDQWFVGAQFLAAGYNIKLSEVGRQGTVIGGGFVGGYKLTLSETFDMDFTLGLGYGCLKYDTYTHNEATNTNLYRTKGVTKNTLIPIQAGVNLIWKIK